MDYFKSRYKQKRKWSDYESSDSDIGDVNQEEAGTGVEGVVEDSDGQVVDSNGQSNPSSTRKGEKKTNCLILVVYLFAIFHLLQLRMSWRIFLANLAVQKSILLLIKN